MFDFIEADEKEQGHQATLWNLYVDEFLKHKFFLDCNRECCPEDIEVLKHELSLSCATEVTVTNRFFELHTKIAVDRLKLTKALPTLRSIHKISSSNSSGNVIVMLLKYLKDCIHAENPEVALSTWYNIFMEIVSNYFQWPIISLLSTYS